MLAVVEQNYQNPSLSLKDLSKEFNLSIPSISRIFKSAAKIGFYDYCCRIRMKKAKELMRKNNLRTGDIVRAVRYDNDASFRRTFLRYEGVSPHDYLMKYMLKLPYCPLWIIASYLCKSPPINRSKP